MTCLGEIGMCVAWNQLEIAVIQYNFFLHSPTKISAAPMLDESQSKKVEQIQGFNLVFLFIRGSLLHDLKSMYRPDDDLITFTFHYNYRNDKTITHTTHHTYTTWEILIYTCQVQEIL